MVGTGVSMLRYLKDYSCRPSVVLFYAQRCVFLLALAGLVACSNTEPAESIVTDTARNRSIEYVVWLPDSQQSAPLVILSHGTAGHYSDHDWLAEELARHGYIVAGLNHPRNTRKDMSAEGIIRVWDRPGDISLLLTSLLNDPKTNKLIDADKVAVFGYLAGGQTAFAIAGGLYNPDLMGAYCETAEKGTDCDLVTDIDFSTIDFSGAGESYQDSRVKAIFTMAPALGPGVTADSLANIDIPVQIVAAADDKLVPPEHHASHYARHTPGAELNIVPKGGHFVFITCSLMISVADFFMDEVDLCGREIDADRLQVQAEVTELAIEFMEASF
jgi:predicted dienelactone hydrolase